MIFSYHNKQKDKIVNYSIQQTKEVWLLSETVSVVHLVTTSVVIYQDTCIVYELPSLKVMANYWFKFA